MSQTIKQRGRVAARSGALSALAGAWSASGRIEKAVARARVHFPYLHAVPPEEEPRFRQLLDWLAESHTFISYSEAVDRVRTGRIDKPYIALSFDDGFASNARTAKILEEYGARGCFFVATGFIGIPTLGEAREFFGYSQGIDEPAMTWDDLEQMKARGHEIENHTFSHRDIAKLSEGQVADQIGQGAEMLRDRMGGSTHFAWPFGRFFHFTDAAANEVYRTGHTSCASAERGAHVVEGDGRLCLRRDHIMTSWPLAHQKYFIAKSAADADPASNDWPTGWQVDRG